MTKSSLTGRAARLVTVLLAAAAVAVPFPLAGPVTAAPALRVHPAAALNPLACRDAGVVASAPQVYTFTKSTDVALVNYVGQQCFTVTLMGGPDNPNPTARSIGSVVYVEVNNQTAYWVGMKRVTKSALRAGVELLSLTSIGKYTLLRALKVVILPKGQALPK